LTVRLASRIVDGVRGKPLSMIGALRGWLGQVLEFQADPYGSEAVRTVPEMLREAQHTGKVVGDCDDASVLSAALAMSVGLPARFVVLGWSGPDGPFGHVYTEARAPDGWVEFDVTRPPTPLPPTRAATYRV